MHKFVVAAILALLAQTAQADEKPSMTKPSAEKRPTKIWNRTGPLGETPNRVTDAYPLVEKVTSVKVVTMPMASAP